MYDRIIVPIAEGAGVESIAQARPLARQLGCTLTLLHVHHPREAPPELEGLPQFRFQGVVESWDERDLEEEAQELEWLNEMAEQVRSEEADLTVTSQIVHAPLARALREENESVLAVVPADPVDGLCATARELLTGGDVPVLLLPGDLMVPESPRILITLDGSHFSEEVLDPALEFAQAAGGRMALLEVVTARSGLAGLLRPGDRTAEAAERFLRDVRQRIPAEHGAVDVRVIEMGNAPAGIAQEARREDVDVVAMATHGRGGLRRLILGSVAESVVRSARIPVLLYRPRGIAARPKAIAGQPAGSN
jgi:nucleotide-binding universal stress UspA family protein